MKKGRPITFNIEPSDAEYMRTLARVSPPQHEVVMAYHGVFPTPTYEQLADVLKIPKNTLKTRLHRGRAKITAWRAAEAPSSENV